VDDITKTSLDALSSAPYFESLRVARDTGITPALSADTHLALMDHLIQGGMSPGDTEHTLVAISPALYDALASHSYGTPTRLTFHTEGDLAVTIEPSHTGEGHLSVAMDTLHDVLVHGLPYDGLESLRDGLGAEGAHMSDLALVESFGHTALVGLGMSGFPHEAVQDIQQVLQQHVDRSGGMATVSRSEALQAYTVATEPHIANTLVMDNGSGREVSVSLDAIRGALEPRWETNPALAQSSTPQSYAHTLAR
jgi:hypothetical protein